MKAFFEQIALGRTYSKTWPLKAELGAVFPEGRVILASRFAERWLPGVAVMTLVVQVSYLGMDYLPQSLAMALMLLSLPFQALLWLGHRSQQQLTPALVNWCGEIRQQMLAAGVNVNPVRGQAQYMDMAKLLKDAYIRMDKAFQLP